MQLKRLKAKTSRQDSKSSGKSCFNIKELKALVTSDAVQILVNNVKQEVTGTVREANAEEVAGAAKEVETVVEEDVGAQEAKIVVPREAIIVEIPELPTDT